MDWPSDQGSLLYNGEFTDGDPSQGIASSKDKSAHMNAVYKELLNAILQLGQTPDEGLFNQLATGLVALSQVPVGSIMIHADDHVEPGYLYCDGSAISKTIYARLYAEIGNNFGENTTDFFLPDLRGTFLRGWNSNPLSGYDRFRAFGSIQQDAIRNITGGFSMGRGDVGWRYAAGPHGVFAEDSQNTGAIAGGASQSGSLQYPGDEWSFDASREVPTADENRPVNMALNFCIKY